jgi:tetratricopeptide (TPR) repeat protein
MIDLAGADWSPTMPGLFSDNPNYRAEIRAILQLHRFWIEGKGESDEADAVRDAADGPWELLSTVERKRLRGLSDDLNAISEQSTNAATEPMNPQAQAKLIEATEARQRGEWDLALDTLRFFGRSIAPALLSYLRGAIWSEAGDPETAAIFFEHAAQLDPNNGTYQFEQKLDELRRDIAVGIVQADTGLAVEFNEANLERIKAKARQ